MIKLEVVNEFVMEFFSLISVSYNGSHWHARCPLCGDSKKNSRKKRFHLDYNDGNPIWQCFNCGRSGSFLDIYAELKGISKDEAKNDIFGFDSLRDRLTNREVFLNNHQKRNKVNYETFNEIREKSIGILDEADGIILKKYRKILCDFIEDRKISPEYEIRIAYEGDFKGRIIVPVIDGDNNIIYFQARRSPGSDIEPKYKNPTAEKSTIILNEHKFDDQKPIIVTEGLIDAFMIGDQGTACLGGFFSDEFLEILFPYTTKGIILAFDNPFVDEAGYKNMMRFILGKRKKDPSKFRNVVKYFLPEKIHRKSKDINIMRVNYDIENMYDYIIKNSYSMTHAYSMLKLYRRK